MRRHSKHDFVLWNIQRWENHSASGAKPHCGTLLGRPTNLSEGNVSTNAFGKSDDFEVLSTQVNKAATVVAESIGGKEVTEEKFC